MRRRDLTMMVGGAAALLLTWWVSDAASADNPADRGDRIEIPIKQTKVTTGEIRYSIPVQVGGEVIDALLATGSTGFRILFGAVPSSSYRLTSERTVYAVSSGNELSGVVAHANITIGNSKSAAEIPFHLVQAIGCHHGMANCPALKSSPQNDDFGLVDNDGFRAIIGTSMPSHQLSIDTPNPLIKFGDAWIVSLPIPGDARPGKLIVNPSAAERNGFTLFPAGQGPNVGGGRDNPIVGCFINNGSRRKFCGPIVLDTSKTGVTIIIDQQCAGSAQVVNCTEFFPQNAHWLTGTNGTIAFDANGRQLSTHFTVEPDLMPTKVQMGRFPEYQQPPPRVLAGVLPYLKFHVLYDYKNDVIGLKAR